MSENSKPNVFFLLLDGVRADKFFGPKKSSLTPNLDSLIKQGTYFSQAIASGPGTIPAVSSIMTGLYPFRSLVKDNNIFRLNFQNKDFIRQFKEHGYQTYTTFQETISILGLEKIFDNSDIYKHTSLLWNGLAEKIVQRFESNYMKEPWIYYLHLYDLHILSFPLEERLKFVPDEFHDKKNGINQYERLITAMDKWLGKIFEKINLDNTIVVVTADHGAEFGDYDEELEKINNENIKKRLYEEGNIFKFSHKIATKSPNLLRPIRKKFANLYTDRKRKNIKNRMIPVLKDVENQNISPYKKRLLLHSAWGSGDVVSPLYDDRFKVPLLFVGPNIPKDKVISSQVRSVDIFPTLTELTKIPTNEQKIHGKNLLPIIQGQTTDNLPAFLEGAVNAPKFITKEWIGVRTPNYKYFRTKNSIHDDVFLFDLVTDPKEEFNIAAENKDIVEKMENTLLDFQSEKEFVFEEINESDDEEGLRIESELRRLGYM